MSEPEDFTDIILTGKLAQIPPLPKRTLKIYVCSNKSDFELERYHLWRNAVPVLQQHCTEYGLDVVWEDVHYGSDADHVQDALRFQNHLDEIKQCYQESIGAFFVCLVGNKYGDCPLPVYLDEEEFSHIRSESFESGKDIKLLDDWYIKDDNSVPVVYRLRPIRDKFPNYDFKPGINQKDHISDIDSWNTTYNNLLQIIQYGATVAHEEGNLNVVHKYKQERLFLSGLEKEINEAMKLSPNGCIILERNIESINTGVVGATAFVDLKQNIAINTEKQNQLKRLKERVTFAAVKENHFKFDIKWAECDNIHKVIEQHGEYIENIVAALLNRATNLVDTNLKLHYSVSTEIDSLCYESLVNLKHCKQLMENYSASGFEKLLLSVQNFLFTGRNNDHSPVLITGFPGCGLSTFMSKICHHARDIFGKETLLIVRYVGLTANSQNSTELLRNICMQLNSILKQNFDLRTYDIVNLKSYYHGLINRISKTDKNLIIAIDGIDELKHFGDSADSGDCDWLSSRLPSKVHLILSFRKTEKVNNVVGKLLKKCESSKTIIYFPKWTFQQLSVVLNRSINKLNRTLSRTQEKAILEMLEQSSPMLLSTGIDFAEKCTTESYASTQNLPSSLTEAIHQKMDSLELVFGIAIIQCVVRYILISDTGITEMELLDVLSSNQELMKSMDCVSKPHCRFPTAVWISIRLELGHILNSTFSNGKQLLTIAGSDVKGILMRKYLFISSIHRQYHLDFAQLFLIDDSKYENARNNSVVEYSRCLLCPQPLLYSNTKYNYRRINETWSQLLKSGDISMLKRHAFCNFEYMLALTHSASVDKVIEVLKTTLSMVLDPELNLLHNTLLLSRNVLIKYPTQLANEIILRLRPSKDLYTHHLEALVTQSMKWCDNYNVPLLVPLNSWVQTPRRALMTSLSKLEGCKYLIILKDNQHILCSFGFCNIAMYHIATNKMIKMFSGHKESISCMQLSGNGSFFVTGSEDGSIRIWKITEGLCTNVIKEHKDMVTCIALTPDDDKLITGSRDSTILIFKVSSGKRTNILKGHKSAVTCVKLNNTGKLLLSASTDCSVIVWCMEELTQLNQYQDFIRSPIRAMDLSIDQTFLLVACDDSTLSVLSFATGSWIHHLNGHNGWINRIVISKNCIHAIAACQDGTVYVYNLRTTDLLETFRGNTQPVTDARLSDDETLIFASSGDTINIWNLNKKVSVSSNANNEIQITSVHVWDNIAATGSRDGSVQVWNLEPNILKNSYVPHESAITCLQISYQCTFIVSGSRDTTLSVWDISLAEVLTQFKAHTGKIEALTIFSDDSQVISLDTYGNFFIWKPWTGQSVRTYNFPANTFVLSSRGSHLLMTQGDQSASVLDLEHETIIAQVCHGEKITCISSSLDDKYIVTGSVDRSVKVWEMSTGKITQVLIEHEASITCVVITEDNKYVVSGATDGNILVWCVENGININKLTGHTDKITTLKLTSRNQLVLSASLDNTVRVWSLQYGKEITMMDLHFPILNFAMTEDASHLMIHLEKNTCSPLLCLHNSPAMENNPSWIPDDTDVLPLTVQTIPRPYLTEYPVPRLPARKRNDSMSSIPEIIKLSPIRAPKSKKRERKHPSKSIQYQSTPRQDSTHSNSKLSAVCQIL